MIFDSSAFNKFNIWFTTGEFPQPERPKVTEIEAATLSLPLKIEDVEPSYEGILKNVEEPNRNEMDALISLPLFRVSGTTMDIEKLYETLQENDKPFAGESSYQQKPRAFNTQWKTRIGWR